MSDLNYQFEGELWRVTGDSWHFVTVPKDYSEHIKAFVQSKTPGFGSIRVKVTLDEHVWKTSLFPDSKSGCYFLPIKGDIRKKAKVGNGDMLTVHLDIDI